MKTNGIATKPTEQLSFGERVLGRLVKIDLGEPTRIDQRRDDETATADLAADIFWNLYKRETNPVADVPPERKINQRLINWMRETPGFENSRATSIANLPASALSTALLTHHLESDEIMGELLRQQNEIDKLAKTRDDAAARSEMFNAAADATESTGDEPGDDDGGMTVDDWREMANQQNETVDQLNAEIESLVAATESAIENAKNDPMTAASISAATRAAADESAATARIMAGFGLSGASDVRNDPTAAVEFMSKINDKIKRIAELAGRVKGFALTAYRERVQTGPVVTRIGVTKNIQNLMPSELALLRPDAPTMIRAAKIAELVESGLLGYQPVGDAEKSGPFVYGLDVSGSMSGERLIVGRAVGLGLAMAAAELGREYILFDFAAKRDRVRIVTSRDDWRDHLEWASFGAGGGTDFDMAIDVAVEQLVKMGNPERADLVFASDGEGNISDETIDNWKLFQNATGARLMYVPVDKSAVDWMGSKWFNVDQIADEIFAVPTFDGNAASNLARNVAGKWS